MALRARTAAAATLIVAAALAAVSPRRAFGPGAMSPGHARLGDRCLACHLPFRSVPAARCLGCHPLATIGSARSTPERTLAARPALARVHALLDPDDCLECHSEHGGPRRAGATPRFAHERLPENERSRCAGCHIQARPDDERHRQAGEACDACHGSRSWRPASVDHARLTPRQACVACHARRRPADTLHAQVSGDCGACHATRAWTPATFAHDEHFVLDRDHNVACRTCHTTAADYKTYTCYGCHEHTPAGMQAEHAEEGVRDLDNCVRCHRSADEHAAREGGRGRDGRRGRERRDREHEEGEHER